MADKPLDQHALVSGVRPDPAAPAPQVIELVGFPGNSTRPGYQRLYLTSTLDYHAEFAVADLLYSTTVPIDSSPFPGHEVVAVSIRAEAPVDFTWTRHRETQEQDFDLDVRLEAQSQPGGIPMARYSVPACVTKAPYCPKNPTLM